MRKFLLFLMPMLCCMFIANAQFSNADEKASISLVRASKVQLGLTAADLAQVKVSSSYFDNSSGLRMVYLQQTCKGIPVYNQMLALAYKGESLVSKAGSFIAGLEKQVNIKSGIPSITAEAAVLSALSDRGFHASQPAFAINRKDNGSFIEFGNMGISRENITAQLMWTPIENSKAIRLSWHVYIIPKTTSDYWMVRVDAESNSILGVDNYTDYDNWGTPVLNTNISYPDFLLGTKSQSKIIADFKTSQSPDVVTTASYRVIPFPAEAPSFPNGAHALVTDPWNAAPGNATSLKWNTGNSGTDYNYTRGNNVWAYQDRSNTNSGSVAASASSSTALPNLTFDFTPDYTVAPTQTTPVPNQQFNITNLFYWNNVIHDVLYGYGFDEVAGNFQDDNQGRGGAGNDHVNAEAQDGSGSNNANFSTPADGGSGRMQMYLWTGGTPQRDGDVDNGIIVHEFGHGVSNRLTGGPAAAGCLGNAEQMGEGWSDYYALMFTQDWANSNLNTGFNSPRGIGTYALFQPPTGTGIRSQKYCTDFTVNNKVYAANIPAAPHDRGEIWCATLWDMTWNIINQVGTINPNLYNVAGGGGNTIALKLVTEGLKLQKCSPGFISGRDAILQADQVLYGGLYNCSIWEAFRRRGMGAFASEGSTSSVNDQIPDFTPPITFDASVSATTIPEGSNLTYVNDITTCSAVSGYTLRDTLPANVTYVSGGTYDNATRVVSFAVNQAAGTTSYPFTVQVNPGSYFPPIILLNEPIAVAGIPAGWVATSATGPSNWVSSTTQSHSTPNSLFAVDNGSAVTDFRVSTSAAIALGATPMELTFWHNYDTEAAWDGGVVEISTNGGTTWTDLGPFMTINGYNNTLDPNPAGTNPIKGRQAFTGNSGGWIKTTVDLSSFVNQNAMFRFRMTSDDNTSEVGWYVDDIVISAKAQVKMRSSLFNASNNRVSYKDMVTEITQVVACAPTITEQPVDVVSCASSSVTFTCVGSATGGVTYQWQVSTAGIGGPYTNLTNAAPYSGVTTSVLTVNPTAVALNGYYYRCVVTGTCAPDAISDAAKLTVAAASVGGTINPANTQVCGVVNSGTLILSGRVGNVIRWESATAIAGPYTAIANNTDTLIFNNLTQTTYYRAVVQFAGCAEANSSIATVTFSAASPLIIVANPGTTICEGDPTLLTVHELGAPVPYSLTQSTSTTITALNSVSCNAGGLHTDNSYWRAYNLAPLALPSALTVTNVSFGIEQAT
ncbi:MAG: M36 family metallopeptidase, partial [Ferruginibacter sp.]|nr:M36 family metallopeptidase [Ferruginibacter sp.]